MKHLMQWISAATAVLLMAFAGSAQATDAEDAFVAKIVRNSENCYAIYHMASESYADIAVTARTMQATARGVYRLYSNLSETEADANLADTEALWRKYIANGEYDLDKQLEACNYHFRIIVAQHNKAVALGIRPTLDLDVPEMHEDQTTSETKANPVCEGIASDFEMRATEMSYTISDAAADPGGEKAEYFRKYGASYLSEKFKDQLDSARYAECPPDLIAALEKAIDILQPLAD